MKSTLVTFIAVLLMASGCTSYVNRAPGRYDNRYGHRGYNHNRHDNNHYDRRYDRNW